MLDRHCAKIRFVKSLNTPAPRMTLDNPLHSDMYPSTLEIVAIALPIPLYIAAGVGLTTCIRVYDAWSALLPWPLSTHPLVLTLSRSMGYMTECSCSAVSPPYPRMPRSILSLRQAYCNPCKCACNHIRCQREVRWKGLISGKHIRIIIPVPIGQYRSYSYSSCSTWGTTRSCAAMPLPAGWAKIESTVAADPVMDIKVDEVYPVAIQSSNCMSLMRWRRKQKTTPQTENFPRPNGSSNFQIPDEVSAALTFCPCASDEIELKYCPSARTKKFVGDIRSRFVWLWSTLGYLIELKSCSHAFIRVHDLTLCIV